MSTAIHPLTKKVCPKLDITREGFLQRAKRHKWEQKTIDLLWLGRKPLSWFFWMGNELVRIVEPLAPALPAPPEKPR